MLIEMCARKRGRQHLEVGMPCTYSMVLQLLPFIQITESLSKQHGNDTCKQAEFQVYICASDTPKH